VGGIAPDESDAKIGTVGGDSEHTEEKRGFHIPHNPPDEFVLWRKWIE
jgi:hypothetical protein